MTRPRTFVRVLISLGLMLGLAAVAMPGVSAQSTQSQLAFVNGTSTEPVEVTVNGDVVASELAYATASEASLFDPGPTEIAWSDGSSLSLDVPGSTAWTAVSGHGEDDATAAVYPIALQPIPEGQASSTVWNATDDPVLVSLNGGDPGELLPGEGGNLALVPAGTTVTVVAGEDVNATAEYTTSADNYVDFFVVDDGEALAVATSVVESMTVLIETLEGGEPPPPDPTVPDVAGQSAAEATATLVQAGYEVSETEEPSETIEAGIAIRTEPAAGSSAAAGSTVTLFVSSGSATVEVPDVTGLPVDDAVAELEEAGFETTLEEQESDEVEEGIVIATNPRAGLEVAAGSEVVVVVSTGLPDVEVPDFLGLTVDEANALAEEVGLEASFVEDPDEPDPDGIVVEQDPSEGEIVPAGSEVVLQLSPATQDPWTSIKLDPNRFLTSGGINFLPETVSEIDVPASDIPLSGRDIVDENGFWSVTIDTSRLDPNRAYELIVTGTAEDGSDYEQTFTIPPVGETVDEPEEDEGVPAWVWFLLGGILIVAIVIGVVLLTGAGTTTEAGAGAAASGAEAGAAGEAAAEGSEGPPDTPNEPST
ncbi:MAG: PASTA domain-containing protein [Acidimicrobiia bacterium]|nr:PASTA domain-containing protein [Acidimicrobiia bacterium]